MELLPESPSPIAANRSPIPTKIIRQPVLVGVLGVAMLIIGIVEIFRLDTPFGWRDLWSASWWIPIGVGFVLSYLTHSITVTPDQLVLRRWWSVETIRTDDFVSIDRNGSWMSRSFDLVTSHGVRRAPWYHPNLTSRIKIVISEVSSEV